MATEVIAPTARDKQTLPGAALRAWRSKRLFAFVLLGVALILGAYLRFHRLTLADLNGDEGFSWAEAIAPNVGQVIKTGLADAGKLPLYYALLHGWIEVFGDSAFAMRSLSAGLGTIAMVLVFAAVSEVCLCLADELDAEMAELAGSFTALVVAVDLRMVLPSRVARMYPLMLVFALVQILFFVRAQRHGKLHNYAGLAVSTAAMVATNMTASFLLVAEALWLGALLFAKWSGARAHGLKIFRPGFAVIAGLALLAPVLLVGVAGSWAHSIKYGFFGWIKLQSITWPYRVMHNSAGNHNLFWIFVALAAFGIWRQRRRATLTSGFMALWTVGPLLAVLGITYLLHPMEASRYLLIAFAGLFALAALGAASFQSTLVRAALASLIAFIAIRPTYRRIMHSDAPDWRKAVALAEQAAPDERVAIIPAYEVDVVRYYLLPDRRGSAVGLDFGCGSERILLFSDWWWLPSKEIERANTCFPRLLERVPMAEVRSRR